VSLKDAWTLMCAEHIKALRMVNAERLMLGTVTVADFMRLANVDLNEGLGQRSLNAVPGCSCLPATIGEIISDPVQPARVAQQAIDLVPLLSQEGHHIPIVDSRARLVAVIAQTDLVRNLVVAVYGRDTDVSPGNSKGQMAAVVAPKPGHSQKQVHRGTIDRLCTALEPVH
jgi:CBS domain-containing membrane protein